MADEEDPPPDDETVLTPQELRLTEKEGVEQLEEGRFVVSPDGQPPKVPSELSDSQSGPKSAETPSATDRGDPATEAADPASEQRLGSTADSPRTPDRSHLDRTEVQQWHARELSESPSDYGYHLSLKAEDVVDHHTLHSDDVTMTFNNLLLWYARTVDADLPPGVVVGILLSDATVPVQFPPTTLEQLVANRGLSTDDSIGDLLETVREDGGVVFPPRTE